MIQAYIVFKHEFSGKKMTKQTKGYFLNKKDANIFIEDYMNGEYETSILKIDICEKISENKYYKDNIIKSILSKLDKEEKEFIDNFFKK